MIGRYRDGKIPAVAKPDPVSEGFRDTVLHALRKWDELMKGYQIHLALGELWKAVQAANQLIEARAPWKLAKDPTKAGELDATLADAAAALELVLLEAACVIPQTAEAGLIQLGYSGRPGARQQSWPAWPTEQAGRALGAITPLFPILEHEKTPKP
jgi:methionyl-tRNA synthetase